MFCEVIENGANQLLHAVAGTMIEAINQSASIAVLVIQEYVPIGGKSSKAVENERDLRMFIERVIRWRIVCQKVK